LRYHRNARDGSIAEKIKMAKKAGGNDDLEMVVKLLQNLLAIELWRSGLSQAEIGKRMGIAKGSVNKMLKGVKKEVAVRDNSKE